MSKSETIRTFIQEWIVNEFPDTWCYNGINLNNESLERYSSENFPFSSMPFSVHLCFGVIHDIHTFNTRSIMRTNGRFLKSAMKSTGLIRTRLQKRKNLNTSKKSWNKSATPSLLRCTRGQEACQVGYPGEGAPPSGGASSGPTNEEFD